MATARLSWNNRKRRIAKVWPYSDMPYPRSQHVSGGNLVYAQKIGVDHTALDKLPQEFTPALSETELRNDKPVRVEHNGVPILLVHRGSQAYAIAETCSHLGGPLSEGTLDEDVIRCPWHRSRFSIRDGHVVDGSAVHPQACLETRIRNGQIEVRKTNCITQGYSTKAAQLRPERVA